MTASQVTFVLRSFRYRLIFLVVYLRVKYGLVGLRSGGIIVVASRCLSSIIFSWLIFLLVYLIDDVFKVNWGVAADSNVILIRLHTLEFVTRLISVSIGLTSVFWSYRSLLSFEIGNAWEIVFDRLGRDLYLIDVATLACVIYWLKPGFLCFWLIIL